ncbi:MAG: sugar ABC transporter ATP-binding protein [Chloroflexi bacterium]|nr:sugar ABC transporter ATP-binding protein [Chloroflexota bacterium]
MAEQLLLKAEGITKNFPGVLALDKVDFGLMPGEVHVLLGENGAGKSTLMKVLVGAYHPDAGKIIFQGQEVRFATPRQAQQLGISIIYQEFNLIPYMNVAQNIFLGRFPKRWGLLDHAKMHAEACTLLASLNMDIDTHAKVVDLGTAQQQMVEVAKALSMSSKVLIMDEPTASLTEREIEQLFATIHRLKKHGIGIVYISHRLQEVHQIGDRVTVLRDGKYVGTRDIHSVDLDELVGMMVGRTITQMFHRDYQPQGTEALRVKALSRGKKLHDINMNLHCGEIVGLAGLVGAGRTELARAIFGVDTYDQGELFVFGNSVKSNSPAKMVELGVGLLPEDRKAHGLALVLPLAENVVMASLHRLFPRRFVSNGKEREVVAKYVQDLRIATPSIARLAQYLSGGTQQKVVLAKWLCTQSKVFIFDEPTRGIDVGAKAEIHNFMNELVKQGAAVLMISSDLPEILGMSDRIYVMREGCIVAEVPRQDATQESIVAYAMGHQVDARFQRKNGNGATGEEKIATAGTDVPANVK